MNMADTQEQLKKVESQVRAAHLGIAGLTAALVRKGILDGADFEMSFEDVSSALKKLESDIADTALD